MRSLAYRNLIQYTYFLASMNKDLNLQKAVESAIIVQSKNSKQPIQNDKVSRRSENCSRIIIHSHFDSNLAPDVLLESISYGSH